MAAAPDQKETYDINGRTEVDETLFDEPTETTPDNGTANEGAPDQTTTQTDDDGTGTETTQDNPDAKPPGDPKQPEQQPKQQTEQPKPREGEKWAGKYDNIEQLANAFRNLGGNPDRYKDNPNALEDAYQVWQSEFTRARQHIANQEELDQIPDNNQDQEFKPDDYLKTVDWGKVQTAEDVIRLTLDAVGHMMKGLESRIPDQTKLAETLQVNIQDREERNRALSYVEGKVPRLQTDPKFRRQFAAYIKEEGGLKKGRPYQEQMDEFMKDFLSIGQAASEEYTRMNTASQQNKAAAQVPAQKTDTAVQNSTKPEDDILGDIVNAHKETVEKFGGIR